MNDFIELTNASDKKLNKIKVKKSLISMIQQPLNTENVGCIIAVMASLIPVKESYEYVSKLIER